MSGEPFDWVITQFVWNMYKPAIDAASDGEEIPENVLRLVRSAVEAAALLTFAHWDDIDQQLTMEYDKYYGKGKRTSAEGSPAGQTDDNEGGSQGDSPLADV